MARKKKPEGDAPKRRKKASGSPLPTESLFHQLLGGRRGAETPLQQAQELMYDAWEEPDPRRRVELARQALALSPDCADAYVLLAEHASSRREALELYRQGVAAGERALGPRTFREDVGHFWGILETRPYMRARFGLAHALWTSGERDEAVGHLWEMLRLNPGDNQGVRYTLAAWLLALDRNDDLARLLAQYPDEGSAFFAYTRALLAFRRGGDTAEARELLADARRTNKHVPAYLLREKHLPEDLPPFYSAGDEREAILYAGDNLAAWRATPGAIDWLRQHAGGKKKSAAKRWPSAASLKRLTALPQQDDAWVVEARRLPTWFQDGGNMVRPWVAVILSRASGMLLNHAVTSGVPPAREVWEALAEAMTKPHEGQPCRPRVVEGGAALPWAELQPHLTAIDVAVEPLADPETLDEMFDTMIQHICREPQEGLLDTPGVTPELAASFFNAAAEFFEAAPWRKVGFESAIEVTCDAIAGGPWYAVVMGQSGMTYGLALYDDLELLRRQWREPGSDAENAEETVATTVTFGEPWETTVADVDAAEKHGWRVARPDAFPAVYRKERGMVMRPPRPEELLLLEATLRAVPAFVNRRGQEDSTPETMTVQTGAGQRSLTLRWVIG